MLVSTVEPRDVVTSITWSAPSLFIAALIVHAPHHIHPPTTTSEDCSTEFCMAWLEFRCRLWCKAWKNLAV